MQETQLLGTGYQQEVHLEKLFSDVAEYDVMVHVPVADPDAGRPGRPPRPGPAHGRRTSPSPTTCRSPTPTRTRTRRSAPARPPATAPMYPRRARAARATPICGGRGRAQRRAARSCMLVGRRRPRTPGTRCSRSPSCWRSPIVKTLPGKAVVPDDHPLPPAGSACSAPRRRRRRWRDADTLFMVGTNFPYTKHLPEPGQVRGRPDRGRPDRGRQPHPHRGAARRRRQGERCARCCRCCSARTDRGFLEHGPGGMADWRREMAVAGERRPRPDPAAVPDAGDRPAGRRRRHPDLGLRDHRHLGGPALRHPGRPRVLPVRQPGHDGARAAVRHRRPVRPSRPAVHRLRRRRRLRHADGRVRSPRSATSCRSRCSSTTTPRYGQILWEQMVLGYPEFGVRHRSVADFAALGRGLRRRRASGSTKAGRPRGGRRRGAGASRAGAGRRATSTPTSRRCRPRSSYEQAKGFAKAFLHGQPHKATIATTLFRDKIARAAVMTGHREHRRPTRSASTGSCATSSTAASSGRLSGLTAVGAVVTGAEIWIEHDRASFGNQMMWLPGRAHPGRRRGRRRRVSSAERMAKTALPVASALVVANGLQGTYLHAAGHRATPRRLARLARYNAEMGPPAVRPAAVRRGRRHGPAGRVLRREGDR